MIATIDFAEYLALKAERDVLREAIAKFQQQRGEHDGEHVYDGGINCSLCLAAYNAAEAELDAALAKAGG